MNQSRLYWARHLLEEVPEKYRDSVMCEAAQRIPLCFCNAELMPEGMRTYQFWLRTCRSDSQALSFVPADMVDEALCRTAVESAPKALWFVPDELVDEAMCRRAVSAMPEMLSCVPEEFRTAELCLEAVSCGRLSRSDRRSLVLGYVPQHLRTRGLCMAAVLNQPEFIQFVPEELRDRVIYEKAVSRSGSVLSLDSSVLAMVPEEERTEELCTMAVISRTGGVLKHVPDRLKTLSFCLMSCRHNGSEIEFVPNDILTPEFCEAVVKSDGHALKYVTDVLFGRQDE